MRVLFVCLGNICRSPTAEGVMQAVVAEQDLDGLVEVDSAGTGGWHVGEPADARMRRAAERRGYDLASRARQVDPHDFERFDLVIAMDRSNLRDLRALVEEEPENLHLFSEFLPSGAPVDVPDPYYGGEQGFEDVLDLIEEGCPVILETLVARNVS